jgi:AbrB family looped-hinge helix DNA binding protein
MSVATLTSKGQITIPAAIRKQLHLQPGDKVDFRLEKGGTARILPLSRKAADVFGILEVEGRKAVSIEEIDAQLGKMFQDRKS